jgi:hypothetical protein
MRKAYAVTAVLVLAACATPVPDNDPDLPQAGDDVASGAAVGKAAIPLAKWLGRVIMRAVTNTTVHVEVKKTE